MFFLNMPISKIGLFQKLTYFKNGLILKIGLFQKIHRRHNYLKRGVFFLNKRHNFWKRTIEKKLEMEMTETLENLRKSQKPKKPLENTRKT